MVMATFCDKLSKRGGQSPRTGFIAEDEISGQGVLILPSTVTVRNIVPFSALLSYFSWSQTESFRPIVVGHITMKKKSKFRKLFGLLSIRVSRLTRLMYHVGQTYIQAINYNHSLILYVKHSNYSFVRSRVQIKICKTFS